MRERSPQPLRPNDSTWVADAARAEKIAGVMSTLERGIEGILGAGGFTAYLRMLARFHSYSFNNVCLIMAQKPDATLVAGFHRWKALGRHVKRGEKGIWIMVPYKRRLEPEEGEAQEAGERFVVTGFGVRTVFDVGQTDGTPLPEPPPVQAELGATTAGEFLDRRLSRWLIEEGLVLEQKPTHPARGSYHPGPPPRIALDSGLTGDGRTKTLAHEAAHYLADHRSHVDRADAETVAESAAFVVLAHFGIDAGAYSFPYVARWAKDRAVLKRNLHTIQQVASTLIGAAEGQALIPEEAL